MSIEHNLQEKISIRIWENYFKRVKRVLKPAPLKQREEILLELQGHLIESIRNDTSVNEADKVLNAIEKLGDPDEFLRPIVADKLFSDASKTLNPKNIILGLGFNFYSNIKRAFVAFLFSLGYIACVVFALMAVLKVFFPKHVGLLRSKTGSITLGFDLSKGNTDILGYWIIPVCLIISILLYIILTKSFKTFIKETK